MVRGKLQRRRTAVVAAYAALAVATTGVPVVASSLTSSAKTVTGDAIELSVADIDASRSGRITVIEAKDQGTVVPGVSFTLQQIKGIDITTEAGWNKAVALTDAEAKAADKTQGVTVTVDENGRAVFDNLQLGVYYVTGQAPDRAPADYVPTKPFVITLPVARVNPDGWRYEVEVYSKPEPGDKPEESTPPKTTPPVTTTPVKPSEPSTTTPSVPPTTVTTTPSVPDEPTTTTEKIRERLASTGANVLGLIAIGLALLIIGGFLITRRRRSEQAGE